MVWSWNERWLCIFRGTNKIVMNYQSSAFLKYDFSLDENKIDLFEQLIKNNMDRGLFPGIEILLFQKKNVLYHKSFGYSQIEPRVPLKINTIFDIASMTKPIVTATLIMQLIEQGILSLDDTVCSILPGFHDGYKKEITIKQLLTHSSGLPAWANLYENLRDSEDAIQKLMNIPLENKPETKIVYSCLGYIILKLIIDQLINEPLDQLAKKYIFSPLGMKNSYFNPPELLRKEIPPTGYCPWRQKMIQGEVHDENCYFFNGLSGNSGMFSTAMDVLNYCNMILDDGIFEGKRVLNKESTRLMTIKHYNISPYRGLGFALKNDDGRPCGKLFSDRSFGHAGFTGTSFWADPKTNVGIILLSNRVLLSYRDTVEDMKSFRIEGQDVLLSGLSGIYNDIPK